MKIHIKGGGWYGCHLALALQDEHDVELTEISHRLFAGASGSNPARLHIGPHYPRSHKTRAACREHAPMFMARYGDLTRHVPHNIYAIASEESLVDYGTYLDILRPEIPLLEITRPAERGLREVEGAIQVAERHVIIDEAREFFAYELRRVVRYMVLPTDEPPEADLVIDCTFCSSPEQANEVARFEPCITVLLEGPTDTAVTIMDGPFPSIYPWNEKSGLLSLTSAKFTPLARCSTWREAAAAMDAATVGEIDARAFEMQEQMARYYPAVREYRQRCVLKGIRAMPASKADARLVQVADLPRRPGAPVELAIRAGKIDAVFEAERQVRSRIEAMGHHRRAMS